MDSDDSDHYHPATAFYIDPVRDEDIDLTLPPTNGIEYLQRVMLEKKKCDKVVSVKLESLRQPKLLNKSFEEIEPTSSPFAPSPEWQEDQVANFSRIRQRVGCLKLRKCPISRAALPTPYDEDGWKYLCLGEMPCGKQEKNCGGPSGIPPLLSIVTSIGQPVVDQLLDWHNQWLSECNHMTHLHGQWLYALLACLELPIHPDTCSNIRSIARTCQNIRSSMEQPDESELAALNLFICLVAKYFMQTDLSD